MRDGIILKPVMDKSGVVLLDVYKDGKWIGSRRTYKQCVTALGLDKPKPQS